MKLPKPRKKLKLEFLKYFLFIRMLEERRGFAILIAIDEAGGQSVGKARSAHLLAPLNATLTRLHLTEKLNRYPLMFRLASCRARRTR